MQKPDMTIDRRGLRNFGLILAGMFPLWFALLLPLIFRYNWPLWPWITGAVLAGLGMLLPRVLKPLYVVWMYIGLVLGWINTRILLSLIFYLLFTPFGFVLRLTGRDAMRRAVHTDEASYRIESESPERERMEHPY